MMFNLFANTRKVKDLLDLDIQLMLAPMLPNQPRARIAELAFTASDALIARFGARSIDKLPFNKRAALICDIATLLAKDAK